MMKHQLMMLNQLRKKRGKVYKRISTIHQAWKHTKIYAGFDKQPASVSLNMLPH